MQSILKDLEILGGVHHGCLLRDENILASTFPTVLNENLTAMGKVLGQIFMGVEGMTRDHREVHVELEESLLIGYHLQDGSILALLTDKNINVALIKTSVRSATTKLLDKISQAVRIEVETNHVVAKQDISKPTSEVETATDEEMNEKLSHLQSLLAEYIGPAARIVFGRVKDKWEPSGQGSLERLPQLRDSLAAFIDNEHKRADFIHRTNEPLQWPEVGIRSEND